MQLQDKHSLYERLGGVYNIATVVDDFIDRVMADPRLNVDPHADEIPYRVTAQGFKYIVTKIVCGATGGPKKYSGRLMRDSNQHPLIPDHKWEAFLDDFQQALENFQVPEQEQNELKTIVESTRSDIVAVVQM